MDLNNVFVLKRDSSSSVQSKGYLFLAVVFGMMCCSSYMGTTLENNSTSTENKSLL